MQNVCSPLARGTWWVFVPTPQQAACPKLHQSGRCMTRGGTALCPCPHVAHLPWLSPHAHEPGSHAARLEKGLGEYRNWWKEVSWKISPGSGSISRQGAQQRASHPMPGRAVPNRTGSGHAMLCPRMPNRAEPNCAMLSHAMLSCALLSCASPGCAEPSHAKLGPH